MNRVVELIKYILKTYPNPEELSKPRLVKLVYLIDWKYAIENNSPFTNIKWLYNHYGPYVDDVINTMRDNPDIFEVKSYKNPYGGTTDKFHLVNENIDTCLNQNVKEIADFIANNTSDLYWSKFISIVYSTYPVKKSLKYSYLDLKIFAGEFNKLNSEKK